MICPDASIVIKLIVDEPGSEAASKLWMGWIKNREKIVAPYFLFYEVLSVLFRKFYHTILSEQELWKALANFKSLPLDYLFDYELAESTMKTAIMANQPTAYDCYYLSLAQARQAIYWTADKKFYKKIADKFADVHCL